MRRGRAALLLVACVAACDDATGIDSVAGVYRLVSVNAQPLPWVSPPSTGFLAAIEHGDLFLRGNGTYGLGIGGTWGWLEEGTFTVDGNRVQLRPDASTTVGGTILVAGDSAVLQGDYTYVFKLAAAPAVTWLGVFALKTVNGQGPPLVEYDTVINGERLVQRVRFDTLSFQDRRFYRRHRSEETVRYTQAGESLISAYEWNHYGAHEMVAGAVLLRPYMRVANELGRDTLRLIDGGLLRRRQLTTHVQEDRYERP